ncbi:MAG: DUF420 domain-containing protein [Candidatus Binatia bacterium]
MPASVADERRSALAIGVLSAVVIMAVAVVMYVPRAVHDPGRSWLPEVNAALNGTAALLLAAGYANIRRGKVAAHRACMSGAFVTSSVFLITYLVHHARVGSVRFQGTGVVRTVYVALLLPHVVLAAAVVPLALTTLRFAWRGRFDRHRRVARVTLPVWLFVSVSGVLVYVLLYGFGR